MWAAVASDDGVKTEIWGKALGGGGASETEPDAESEFELEGFGVASGGGWVQESKRETKLRRGGIVVGQWS